MTRTDVLKHTKSIALIVVGTLILALGTSIFMLPYDLVTGGISGYAIVLSQVIPAEYQTGQEGLKHQRDRQDDGNQ